MELAGYEFATQIGSNKYTPPKIKLLNSVWKVWNWFSISSDLVPRYSTLYGGEGFLGKMERFEKVQFNPEDKHRFGAAFSALANFLGGRARAPLITRKNFAAKLIYIFATWPMNQVHLYTKYINSMRSDEKFREFLAEIADSGLMSDEAYTRLSKYPPKLRAKFAKNILRLLFMFSAASLLLYAVSKNWNVAARGLIQIPILESAFLELFMSLAEWMKDPSKDKADTIGKNLKSIVSIVSVNRVADAWNVHKYGVIQTANGTPVFVEPTIKNIVGILAFGRSSLPEYERAYPSTLSVLLGGNKEAGEVRKLRGEEEKRRREETDIAVDLLKLIQSKASTDEVIAEFVRLKQEGKLTDSVREKVATYLKEQATGVGPLERSIAGLTDAQQAKFIWEKINSDISTDELVALLAEYKRKGLLTENVRSELRKLIGEEAGAGQELFAQ